MKSCGRAVDLSVASFLVCDLISFVVGCAIHIKTIFFLPTRTSQFCSLAPKYIDSYRVCSDLYLSGIHQFHVLVTVSRTAPTCTRKY